MRSEKNRPPARGPAAKVDYLQPQLVQPPRTTTRPRTIRGANVRDAVVVRVYCTGAEVVVTVRDTLRPATEQPFGPHVWAEAALANTNATAAASI